MAENEVLPSLISVVMVFLRVPLRYYVSSDIAGDLGSGVVGLVGLDSPDVWSRAFASSDTVMSLSVRSILLCCLVVMPFCSVVRCCVNDATKSYNRGLVLVILAASNLLT